MCASSADNFRAVLQQGVDRGIYRDLAVGWIDGSHRQSWFFGKGEKPTAESQFEIGAVTQVFTGLLLGQAIYDGKLKLESTVGGLLGAGFSFADSAVAGITLKSLATHRSGLRMVPSNLFPEDVDDPYATYSSRDLLFWLVNSPHAIGDDTLSYSILDSGLLGFLLARQYAGGFKTVLRDHVLGPMGLKHTDFRDAPILLSGYSAQGLPAAHWHFDVLAGAAGLRSSLSDLLHFVQQNLRPGDSALRASILLARQPYASTSLSEQVGLGWNIFMTHDGEQSWPLVWSASRTGGFSAFVGFRTDKQQGLVLLGNCDVDLSAIGVAWLDGRAPPDLPKVAKDQSVVHADEFAGLYEAANLSDVIVRNGTAGLTAQWPGQAPVELEFVGQDIFTAPGLALTLSFQRESGKVINVVIDHAGVNVLARRLSASAPRLARASMTMAASLREEISGDYRFDAHNLIRIRSTATDLTLQMTA
ncbi:MAG TPA: serine hydrolase, partial [Rudaea sp.]|nr:serine hydrolase [Rudaea sp.]